MSETLNWALLSVFVPTFFATSISPGLCMTLSMTTGMAVGLRRSLWMMLGELAGVGTVAVAAVIGVAAVLLSMPALFSALKWAGGLYLAWVGWRTWHGSTQLEAAGQAVPATRMGLILQGFVTATANPKGWAICIALLPPFLDDSRALLPQLSVLVLLILLIEFVCLLLYAQGGQALRRWLTQGQHLRMLNRLTGALLLGVGVWLAVG